MKRFNRLWYIATVVLLTFGAVSCRTMSPLTAPTAALSARAVTDIVPQWQPFAEDQTAGLAFFAGKVRSPHLEFWAIRADLTDPAVEIVVTGQELLKGASDGFITGHVPSTTISGFAKRYNAIVGINTNPFSPVSGRVGEDRLIDGITISDGALVALPHPAFDALVFYNSSRVDNSSKAEDGSTTVTQKAAIVNQGELGDLNGIQNAVGGFSIVLQSSTIPDRLTRQNSAPRHPRSAAGLSADGSTLYLLLVDGRRPGSIGVTEAELGVMLRQLGAVDGLNFDGGGSSALVLRFPDGKVRAVNIPIHKQVPGWQRGVAACLGIRITGQ
ncbi:hypothetical protein AGMMS49991_05170 [Spirochaetia bacterium]|nr:hypothetical protein AGMMS49991_05170 [Spirochaetia bacterium]